MKPDKTSFIGYPAIQNGVFSLVAITIAYLALNSLENTPVILKWIITALFFANIVTWITLPVKYRKEEYLIKKDKIIFRRGNIFSDQEIELLYKNITHVTLKVPYFQNYFYNTGNVLIQSAGGSGVEVNITHILRPHEVYEKIIAAMRANGFSIQRNNLIKATTPIKIGVVVEVIFNLVAAGTFVAIVLAEFHVKGIKIDMNSIHFKILCFAAAISTLLYILYSYGRALNQNYQLHDDAISSDVDFFNITQTLIPIENLSDSELEQGFAQRIINTYNIKLSCQGSGQEISFAHVRDAESWKKALDIIIKKNNALQKEKKKIASETPQSQIGKDRKPKREVNTDTEYTKNISMNSRRAFMLSIVLFVLAAFIGILGVMFASSRGSVFNIAGFILLGSIFFAISAKIIVYSTVYKIKKTSFERNFRFITTQNVEFNTDKITGVCLKENPLDRACGTFKVVFWSIGAKQNLNFEHIDKNDEIINKILAKVAVHNQEKNFHSIYPKTTLSEFIKAHLFSWMFIFAISIPFIALQPITAIIPLAIFIIAYAVTNWHHSFCRLDLHEDFIRYQKGIFFKSDYYALYDNIKYAERRVYPWSKDGDIRFEVAGEVNMQSRNQKNQQPIPVGFTVYHLQNVEHIHKTVDLLFSRDIKSSEIKNISQFPQPQIIHTTKPSMTHSLFPTYVVIFLQICVIIALFFSQQPAIYASLALLFVIFDGIMLSVAVSYVKRIKYSIDKHKITKDWGLFYKKSRRIHFEDVDFLGKKQRFLHQIFKTGNVTINTVGSSRVDLNVANVENFIEVYEILRKYYQ